MHQSRFVRIVDFGEIVGSAFAGFELGDQFFSSPAVRDFARGGPAPLLPEGITESEKRGRKFFEDTFDPKNLKAGACAACHSGPMLDRTNQFFPVPAGSRFQSAGVSEFNEARDPVYTFVFRQPDGSEKTVVSPDPGRALITGKFEDANQFKISALRGLRKTSPYFHDNSARTLEEVAAHYARLFAVVVPNNELILSAQDQADIAAYLRLLE